MHSPPLILFDLDGTLVDSGPVILHALNQALVSHGLDAVPAAEIRRFVGPPLAETVPALLEQRGADPCRWDELVESYRSVYRVTSVTDTKPFDGIVDALDALGARAALGVVTSKPLPLTLPILNAIDLTDRFAVIEGPAIDGPEPKRETLGRALAQIRPNGSVTMVGDRHHDIEAGRYHGIRTVGVTWGYGDVGELAGADHIVHQPVELTDL